MTAPAARSRATRVASRSGRRWANGGPPAVVVMPATSMMSLIPIGTPWSAPGLAGRSRRSSSRDAPRLRAASSSTTSTPRSRRPWPRSGRGTPRGARRRSSGRPGSRRPRRRRRDRRAGRLVIDRHRPRVGARPPAGVATVATRYLVFRRDTSPSCRNTAYSRRYGNQRHDRTDVAAGRPGGRDAAGVGRDAASLGDRGPAPDGALGRRPADRPDRRGHPAAGRAAVAGPGPADRRPAPPATASPASSPGSRRTASRPSSR